MPRPFLQDPFSLPSTLQELTPAQAVFCLQIARFLEKELTCALAGTRLLVGFSGGADSTALLLCLHYLAPKLGFALTAAHLDHGLRPASAKEAASCQNLCRFLHIPFVSAKVSWLQQKNSGTESNARLTRYAFYKTAARKSGCTWIVTGHTANDLAEDILMRLIRGTGWPGLGGMPALDKNRRLLRPLLLTNRADIEKFLLSLGLGWITDESNADRRFFRNRIRHGLLPLILEENPAFLDATAGLWKLARIDEAYFAALLPDKLFLRHNSKKDQNPGQDYEAGDKRTADDASALFFSPKKILMGLPQALRLRLYKKILAQLGPGQALFSTLLALDAAWQEKSRKGGSGEKTIHQFPGGKLVDVEKKGITWHRPVVSKKS